VRILEAIVKRTPRYLGVGSLILAGLVAAGCAPKSQADKVAELRGYYSARLNGFILEEEPMITEVPELEAVEILDEGVIDGVEPGEVVDEVAAIEVREKIRLDILIQHRSNEKLPGLTVDVSMVDSAEMEKGHWRVWFDTSQLTKATVTQFTHVLEEVGYEEGDGFFVEVRQPIPVEERGDYREFSQAP
jgi:hypothetical protein